MPDFETVPHKSFGFHRVIYHSNNLKHSQCMSILHVLIGLFPSSYIYHVTCHDVQGVLT